MRARVSWILVLAVYLAFPRFQRDRLEEMGFGEVLRAEWMRADAPLTQALRSRWDTEATVFVLPWGHIIPNLEDVSRITGLRVYRRPVSGYTYPCYRELAHRLLGLTVGQRSSLVSRVELQESLGLFETGRRVAELVDEQPQRLTEGCNERLASEPGAQADLDLHRFLTFFLGRLLFSMRGDSVHYRFLPLLEDLGQVGSYASGAAFLAHQFKSLGSSDQQTAISGFYPFLQVWAYLHLPDLRRGTLERPSLVPIARRWVVWRPYLEEGDEGQPWLVQARPYFGRSVWVHALNLVLPLHLHLFQRSLGLRQSAVEFPSRDRTPRPGRSFRGLHDTTDWREQAKEHIQNWERRGNQVKSTATSDDAYLQAFALKYRARVYKGAQRQVDVAGEIASLRAMLHSAVQNREVAQWEAEQLRRELDRVRRAAEVGASSSRAVEGSQSDLEDRLEAVVRRAEEVRAELAERETELRTATDRASQLQGQVDIVTGERDQLRIRAEAAESQVAEATRELATLRVQGSSVDQKELAWLHADLHAQQTLARGLHEVMTTTGRSQSRSRSGVSGASGATGTFIRQYLVGSSSRRRNEDEERRLDGKTSARSGRGGSEMPPPPDRHEGSGESGGGQ
ncbi:hypothetical protein Taro_041234 [Colocasia esculenta]|uniref:Aminotransferase-like plant mobile domain-containing protein n=1 Tax=Colocasia esculenta TaxID=4460 RepID=A0A843WF97_COLES|nr:hypothetical protein [Colocasia esculenta]